MASLVPVGTRATFPAERTRPIRAAVLRACCGVALLAAGAWSATFEVERVLVLQPYNADRGGEARFLYELSAPTFPFVFRKLEVDGGMEPRFVLKEDGRPLGPRLGVEYRLQSSVEREIEIEGRGRFAYAHGHLHFSASDNSDPRGNGRFYHLAYAIGLSFPVSLLLMLTGFLLAGSAPLTLARPRSASTIA
ncbi:MAG: hypothetical protein F9K44_05155 [Hyphomicrobiaceae bacterium]|nr:MAG: hypothetical protein F9K44_05155 [Hyphomicrobiaceae bacterium]